MNSGSSSRVMRIYWAIPAFFSIPGWRPAVRSERSQFYFPERALTVLNHRLELGQLPQFVGLKEICVLLCPGIGSLAARKTLRAPLPLVFSDGVGGDFRRVLICCGKGDPIG